VGGAVGHWVGHGGRFSMFRNVVVSGRTLDHSKTAV
jgi:hypothetical protein